MSKIIGIDLGTTNCAVTWTDSDAEELQLFDYPVPQLTYPGTVEKRSTLPSFLYIPGSHELPEHSTELPWDAQAELVVGWLAREQSAKIPHRIVGSAKSWLSNDQVDRHGAILPWQAPAEISKLSPVEVSAAYLAHIRSAWDYEHPDAPMSEQEIVLTVPASFDAVARELTVEAAHAAGLNQLTLLEEPQAALYSWIAGSGDDWRKQVGPGDRILVCDVGGGTTDFSLITVTDSQGDLALERVAVGDHILLGGDNMDLTLAMAVRQRLKNERSIKLDSWQMQVLTHGCRVGKEQLLQEYADDDWPITIPGRGSSLIASSINTELKRSEAEQLLIEGFFPVCTPDEELPRHKRSGLTELGLPFEADPGITRHLARFLKAHAEDGTFFRPTAILFNGGVFKSPLIRERVVTMLNIWLETVGAEPIRVLKGIDQDLAVSRGAARYGAARHGKGLRIRGGTNRSYYIGIENSAPAIPGLEPEIKALCVAPFGMEEGTEAKVPERQFGLVVGEPVEFRFLGSTIRKKDTIGEYLEDWEDEVEELTAIGTTLPAGDMPAGTLVPVTITSHVTEIGTLELWCQEVKGNNRWKLEFEVRALER
ncbi:Hsp70 family protein [bacterium]|nr:Hsp70 family protein [bacterium]